MHRLAFVPLLGLVVPCRTFARLTLNVSHASVCSAATDVCSCSELSPGCGWCSSTHTCEPADKCTTTCRECPVTHKTCRSSCRRKCINTCALAQSVCSCSEIDGCGWCSHSVGARCQPYPECSTTCDECDSTCANYKHCRAKCYTRFRADPDFAHERSASFLGLRPADGHAALAAFGVTVLASAAGIGGGALLVPIFTMVGSYTEHEAIPLSKATILGSSSFTVFGSALWQRHPLAPHRPIIQWSLAEVLVPPMLLGVTVGVYLNHLCPNWLIMVLAAVLCLLTGGRSFVQARSKWEEENRHGSQEIPVTDIQLSGYASLRRTSTGATAVDANDDDGLDDGSDDDDDDDDDEARESKSGAASAPPQPEPSFPLRTICSIVRAWLVVLTLGLLKGGHGLPSLIGLQCGSAAYYLTVLSNFPILGGLTYLASRSILRRQSQGAGTPLVKGDVVWDEASIWRRASAIGVMSVGAGCVGLGGGQIIKPIFTEMGLLQQVSTATAALMMLFMSSTTVTQFLLFGALEGHLALFYGTCGVLGSIVGNNVARAVLLRTGRPSIGIMLLAFLLLGSGVLMVASGMPKLASTGLTSFRPICGRVGAAARSHD